ncbi:Cna B-type domain-containing protein [Hespellia stercorisuis]|uniref:CNA-B domain-containing protein n=1 Tax=Hespellia stercorisuis DSM 15480 TaxID=1121950 RepID=A0A1M6I2W2_9FIRM|nr:Cna B-type domain-containing protein [Hespellia stercorisuis]SHJ28750.1 hypothetical protein SAMN02745243_00202 [Hespellia stercorisuis DSM 15480]
MKCKKIYRQIIAYLLIITMLMTQVNVAVAAENDSGKKSVENITDSTDELTTDEEQKELESQTDTSDVPSSDEEETEPVEEADSDSAKTQEESVDISLYYQDNRICIYNEKQLVLIGSGQAVKEGDIQEGSDGGKEIQVNGTPLLYGLDSNYYLMNDISLSDVRSWTLPESFTGTFVSGEITEEDPLYDEESDTIFIYNRYQLALIMGDTAETEPVMSQDMIAENVGLGNFIYPSGEEDGQNYLTYSSSHHYAVSQKFTEATPELKANTLVTSFSDEDAKDGRSYAGQVVYTNGGKEYILIGNKQQLETIGKPDADGKYYKVTEPVWGQEQHFIGLTLDLGAWTDTQAVPTLLYTGDADITADQTLYAKDTTYKAVGGSDHSVGMYLTQKRTLYIGSKKVTDSSSGAITYTYDRTATAHNVNMETTTDLTYSPTANYIIFRDIDLTNEAWTPMMFSGTMIGAKATAGSSIWDDSGITASERPVISNVSVEQTGELPIENYIGIGFFGTITNEINVNNVGVSAGTVSVSNIAINNIAVNNASNTTKNTQTVISGLTTILGGLLGGVVDLLIGVISFGNVKLNLKDTLSALLNARAEDPTIFATGTFAGRVVGDVNITNCTVSGNVMVSNINDRTGGFVGYSTGMTEYDGLSDLLGITVNVLSSLLNAIPGLGLGDLITILLDNALPVGSLIPTDYINPVFANCSVEGLTGTLGQKDKNYSGGFVGQQVGTIITDSTIADSTYTIQASGYGGGFSGLARDAEIKGLLSDVGVELLRLMQPQSMVINSSINNSNVTVSGGNYLGGFIGAQTNSYAINDSITGSVDVSAAESFAGGFSGIATVGWLSNLGKDEVSDTSLLSTVKELLTGLLGSNSSKGEMLLSLVGVSPSAILGCQINGASVKVAAKDYAGGMLGRGDGVYLAASSAEYLEKLSYWKYDADGYTDTAAISERNNILTGLQAVSVAENYAGGIAGSVGTASVGGLLNGTIGLGGFLGFTAKSVTVTGVEAGYEVSATGNYAGGGFGEAVGGTIADMNLSAVKSISANNRSGGFAGCVGPGDLAGTGGLKLSLLGLNLLKANGLLSVAQGVNTTIENIEIYGISDGFTVEATGTNGAGDTNIFTASGFIAKSNSTQVTNAKVTNLRSVKADGTDGVAGGFIGTSQSGGLADVSDETSLTDLIQAGNLLTAVSYLIPKYTTCSVSFVDGGFVEADTAGGFAGDFQSGTVDNSAKTDDYYAVYNIDHVTGGSYGGGFGGKVYSGGLADSNGGLSILGGLAGLSISSENLLGVVNAYVPFIKYAGVKSDKGFTVVAATLDDMDAVSGSAGGFIGYGSGVQISNSDVTNLKNTKVTEPKTLEAVSADSYFNNQSTYSVTGGRYAGGYIGSMDIGSAASVGGGLKILGNTLQLTNILDALSVVVSTIEHSDVTGNVGGFSVLATEADKNGAIGMAGGFAGNISGGHIQDSNSYNFSYVIGQIAAGGYVGNYEPGNVANVLGDASILGSLVDTQEALASLAEDFVPTIRNSSTTCIPCGGAVRAQASSDTSIQRGMAGGYAGHNEGGNIWGMNTDGWKSENTGGLSGSYTGTTRVCEAIRIRSVYGAEYAGGYTGLMESADTADTGSLKLLWGLVKVNNLLGALSIVYPTEENTAVYGPLAKMDMGTWNSWVEHIGVNGGFGADLAENGTVTSQGELDAILSKYIYGYHVVAGRAAYESGANVSGGGCAGGYVGAMHSGTITNGQAYEAKLVTAMRAAGGFAGEMFANGAAKLGSVDILGLKLDVGSLLNVVDVFVPVIKVSSVTGYQSGLTVKSIGTDIKHSCGYAGGYAGYLSGGQIWGDAADGSSAQNSAGGCDSKKLYSVTGSNSVGGYVGLATAGSVLDANTNASSGLLQGILDTLISTPNSLLSVLQATVSTIRGAKVTAVDDTWGYTVNGSYKEGTTTKYAKSAGGFAGSLEAAVLGDADGTSKVTVEGLRGVIGGLYAGGFFGLADVSSVASVSGNNTSSGKTTILGLVQAGEVSVLDAFRTYIYYGGVTGISEGFQVKAMDADSEGILDSTRYTGNAGGFGGGLLNGSIKNSNVQNLSSVLGMNYTGGFVGHLGKNGTVDVDNATVADQLNLLGATAGVLDVFGSHVDDSTVTGISEGYTVKSSGGTEQVAGGFAGYSDLSKLDTCKATNLKKVTSGQIAGGFVGETKMNYVANVEVSSTLLNVILKVVNALVKLLYLDKAEDWGVIDLGIGNLLGLKVLSDGQLLYVNLLGLKIGVALSKADTENEQLTDVAIITLGDSTVKLPCTEEGIDSSGTSQLAVTLIKGNRSNIVSSRVTGIARGYDVYGGGATDDADGTAENGYSGGFIGINNEGVFENNVMTFCDVVRGTKDLTGPFTGTTNLKSTYYFNTIRSIEGTGNQYSVYRALNEKLSNALTAGNSLISEAKTDETTATAYNRYDVKHLNVIQKYSDLKDAVMAEDSAGDHAVALAAYESPAKAVLMSDTKVLDINDSLTPEPGDMQDPCEESINVTIQKIWKDWNDWDKLRPDAITVTIYQNYTDAEGKIQTVRYSNPSDPKFENPLTLTATENGSNWSATWKKVVEGLPVAFKDKDGTIRYYFYTVEETTVDGYITTIEYDNTGYVATITNRHDPELPFTGGKGLLWLIILGVAIGGYGIYRREKRKKEKLKESIP